ncbi:phosphodiester glycosidase family protein [Leptolyngbya sp. FACHB-711]|uniref:phosphodiester glycosidase family protein n=1 Tax=unclassified Leptolyngbya TaxID=2650499 RepID=UPI001682820B|nr:phosphodiester glycosidase family protein [Cyanobacteria bacterium FACHB-502]MBD2027624.1 phosphodiester glycosidase family protein [Leptolyngbya sp. FACHB-711]
MTNPRIRTHRRRRYHQRRLTYVPQTFSLKRVHWILTAPLLVVALSLALTRQRVIANTFEQPIPQKAFLSPAWVPTLAQATIPVPLTRQGGQITLNGRPLDAIWSQRQQQIGISDAALARRFGVNLLSSNDETQQPIEWFSNTADGTQAPLKLSTWLTEQYRYLNISTLAQQFGWEMQISGANLQINTPPAKILSVRQGRQSWGDRIVIDLDRATPWQISEEGNAAVITLDAPIAPALLRGFSGRPGSYIRGLNVASSGDRTVIRLRFADAARPRVWSLNNPNRILVDIRADALQEQSIAWSPGMRWAQQYVNLGGDRFPVVALEIDPRSSEVQLKPIWGNPDMKGTQPLVTTAQRSQAAAAINGGFFNRNNQLPLGAIRRDGRWMSGPILNRGAIGWDENGNVTIAQLSIQETLLAGNGNRITLRSLNSGFVNAGTARYTREWGASYTPILNNEVVMTVQNNQVVRQQQMGLAGQTPVSIPSDGYLLVVRSDRTASEALRAGTSVQIEMAVQPDNFSRYSQILGGGPVLMLDGQIVLNPTAEQFSTAFIQQAASRSVIATTGAGKLMLITVHNRIGGAGPTLAETAQITQQLGAMNALNLDGGSSTSLYLGGQLIDRPASTAARVHNGIGVFVQPRL